MALFTAAQLRDWLRLEEDLPAGQVDMVEQVVAGWLIDATEIDPLPDPPTGRLFAWALELGGIAVENPTSLSSEGAGSVSAAWSPWQDRRKQILTAAREWSQANGLNSVGAPPAPVGSFPVAVAWPDEAVAPWRGRSG